MDYELLIELDLLRRQEGIISPISPLPNNQTAAGTGMTLAPTLGSVVALRSVNVRSRAGD